MAKPRCDVAGCTRTRQRWQRVCERCFALLPRRACLSLIMAYRLGDKPAWRALKRETGNVLAGKIAAENRRLPNRAVRHAPRISAQQAFHNHQRLLGEQD